MPAHVRSQAAVLDPAEHFEFIFNAHLHDSFAKIFSFAIYPDGGKMIPARAGAEGIQDGLDFIEALAASPHTAQNPPDVAGWEFGRNWFSTGSMLARMNFGATLADNQRLRLVTTAAPCASTPDALVSFVLDSMRTAPLGKPVITELSAYLQSTGAWTGSRSQLEQKVAGLVHLVACTAEYQFI